MTISWYWWIIFGGVVTLLVASDLWMLSLREGMINFRSALSAIALRIGLAVIFNVGIYMGWLGGYAAPKLQRSAGLEFLTAYLVEMALSLDNMFVLALIFHHFRVLVDAQQRILLYGVLGALGMRAFFIFAGLQVLHCFQWIIYLCGGVLIVTGVRMLIKANNHPCNFLVEKWAKQILPISEDFHGSSFFIRKNDTILATPLFVVLLVVETTDLIFAIDSIPAILGVTYDGFILLTSNVFAILGLRAMYFAIVGCIDRFRFLHLGLSAVLVFIGLKMILNHTPLRIGIVQSLAVVLTFLFGSILASIVFTAPKE